MADTGATGNTGTTGNPTGDIRDLNLVERAEQFRKTLYLNTQDNTNQIDESKYKDAINELRASNRELQEANKVYSKAIMQPGKITDEDIKVLAKPYPEWNADASYPKGTIINYQGQPYITIQDIPVEYKENPTVAMTMYQKYNKDMLYLDAYGNVIKPNDDETSSSATANTTGTTGRASTTSTTTGTTGNTGNANVKPGTTGATGATGRPVATATSGATGASGNTDTTGASGATSTSTGNTGTTGTSGTTGTAQKEPKASAPKASPTSNVNAENLNDAGTTVQEPKASPKESPKASPDESAEEKQKHPMASLDDVIGEGNP